ncbi:MAG: threonine synthase [Rhodospirillaceae bacterium]|nr:threonine synthase [Rhodospirillaceae bacterium]MYB15391.1 threonine synthase [Rhodospirillaceae bacterium]MYI48390.1 threonine synthase [Rhodospirillaceae bacterium]
MTAPAFPYISTRGEAPQAGFDDILLSGLARDGGLYVPDAWPAWTAETLAGWQGLSYAGLAAEICAPFMAGSAAAADLPALAEASYAGFDDPAVAPLVPLEDGLYLQELFHGPTLAFKDYALQLVGQLFDAVLSARGERITVVGATSGDTGPAGIAACAGRDAIDIFMLHPAGRTSEVQRRQMTTVQDGNVFNIAVEGTFDDCQDMVKALFADDALRDRVGLSAVNSINWARVMGQIVYYVHAALQTGAPERPVSFAVPTGNFGNVFAGYGAGQCGLPVARLIVGSNANDILTRFFRHNAMEIRGVTPTLSPSMDIQVSSNFERLLFDLLDRDGAAVASAIGAFRTGGCLPLDDARWRRAAALFDGASLDDEGTVAEMRRVYERTGRQIDPHTAVGLAAARQCRTGEEPVVVLSTAHPAKFPDAVERATGRRPALPPHLADLHEREERCVTMAKDTARLTDYVLANARAARG